MPAWRFAELIGLTRPFTIGEKTQGSARVARSVAMGGALRFRGQPVVRHVVMSAEIAYGRRSGPMAFEIRTFLKTVVVAGHHPSRWLRRERIGALVVGALVSAVVAVLSGLALSAAGDPYVVPALAVWVALQLLLVITLRLQRRDLDQVARLVPLVLVSTGVVLAVGEAWNGPAAVIAWSCLLVGLISLLVARSGTWTLGGIRAELTPRWQLHRGASGRWSVGAGITMLDHEIVHVVRQRETKAAKRLLPAFLYRIRWPASLAGAVLARHLRTVIPVIGLVMPLMLVALPGAITARRRSIRSAAAETALLSTPFGAVSLQTVNRVIAGPDMALLSLLVASWLM
ncbi:hypothetical protein [Streptomyces sp. 6N223]|uniref:hypothetical protein n=1 Tax=Streptomyces sp. 6N223 TaxID=3457412 RepID=UPI003FCF1F81